MAHRHRPDGTGYFTSSKDPTLSTRTALFKWRYERGGYLHASPATAQTERSTHQQRRLTSTRPQGQVLGQFAVAKFHHDLRNTGASEEDGRTRQSQQARARARAQSA